MCKYSLGCTIYSVSNTVTVPRIIQFMLSFLFYGWLWSIYPYFFRVAPLALGQSYGNGSCSTRTDKTNGLVLSFAQILPIFVIFSSLAQGQWYGNGSSIIRTDKNNGLGLTFAQMPGKQPLTIELDIDNKKPLKTYLENVKLLVAHWGVLVLD